MREKTYLIRLGVCRWRKKRSICKSLLLLVADVSHCVLSHMRSNMVDTVVPLHLLPRPYGLQRSGLTMGRCNQLQQPLAEDPGLLPYPARVVHRDQRNIVSSWVCHWR